MIKRFSKLLLDAGFLEAEKRPLNFYKVVNDCVAFIVDIVDGESVEIYYGFSSTAFTKIKGDENTLLEYGVDKEYITLRKKETITSEKDEIKAEKSICEFYQKYHGVSKDELLALAEEKRKNFLKIITEKLKPYGFRKNGRSSWIKDLSNKYYVSFNAQKSFYSDQYYFNVYIGQFGTRAYGDCFSTRVSPEKTETTDWQLILQEKFSIWIDTIIENLLFPIISKPLIELGEKEFIWQGCECDRLKCKNCWVEKNIWGV